MRLESNPAVTCQEFIRLADLASYGWANCRGATCVDTASNAPAKCRSGIPTSISVTSEATWRRYACRRRQVEVADLAQRVSRCAIHQVFRQSVEPGLINHLQLLQFRCRIMPPLRSA